MTKWVGLLLLLTSTACGNAYIADDPHCEAKEKLLCTSRRGEWKNRWDEPWLIVVSVDPVVVDCACYREAR